MLVYTFKLNGEDITESVSIGAVVREILSEPLDLGSFHLPFDFYDIEYKLKGLLEIKIDDVDEKTEEVISSIKYDFIIIDDNPILSDRVDVYTHDLQLIEYTAKYDDYDIKSLAYTKGLEENSQAPFQYVINDLTVNPNMKYPQEPPAKQDDKVEINQYFYLEPLDIKRQYYNNEVFRLPQVDEAIIAINEDGLYYFTYEFGPAFIKVKNEDTGSYINFGANGYVGDTTKFVLSEKPFAIYLPSGNLAIEYGFWRKVGGVVEVDDFFDPLDDMIVYSFKIRVVSRRNDSIYDLLMRVSDMVSKFGGVESKQYFNDTRLFTIDDEIADYLKSIEAPQTYVQNATLRQVLNLIFSYVNAISRLKYNNSGSGLDILTMDEFDKITGEFELVEIATKEVKRSGSELTIKAVSNLERTMPTTLDEPTVITPAKGFYKNIRAIDINMTEINFELKLEKPLYKPTRFTTLIKDVSIYYDDPDESGSPILYGSVFDLVLDLTKRLITREKWLLKEVATNFPNTFRAGAFTEEAGLAKWATENLYWQIGDKHISMSDVFGALFRGQLIKSVILSALEEYATLNPPRPILKVRGGKNVMCPYYRLNFSNLFDSDIFFKSLLFNLEYISLEDMVVDSERKDDDDNFNYYGTAKLSQSEKLINVMAQTRGASADLQRTGQRDMVVGKFHETLDSLLKVGMINQEHRLTITERTLVLHNEFIQAVYGLSRDFNRKVMFRGLQQEYRWSEIPTSKQVFQRNEMYKDYIIIDKLDGEIFDTQVTKVSAEGHKIILETLINKDYNESKRITIGYVRTDGMLEGLDSETHPNYNYLLVPITTFGVDGGLSFSFLFENNMVVGDALGTTYGGIGNVVPYYFSKAVRYTNEDGIINKLWFALKNKNDDLLKHTEEKLDDYPLRKSYDLQDTLIQTGHPNLNDNDSDYIVIFKDSSQVLKMTYQLSIIPKNPIDYVIGTMFYSHNLLVKDRDSKDMYVYLYDDESYKYGVFDTLKVKSGWYDQIILTNNNVSIIGDIMNKNVYELFIDLATGIDSSKLWAIGDEFGNLYIACNSNEIGFKSTRVHFRPSIIEIGKE